LSLRPSIFAADIAGFRSSLAAVGDLDLVDAVKQFMHDRGSDATAAEIEREMKLLSSGGWAGKPEIDRQVYLVGAFAHVFGLDSDAAIIHWGDWKIGAYGDYFDAVKPVLPPPSMACCEFLYSGRAMFGTEIDTEWSYYSYLMAVGKP
jgi:hypothetical protein